MWRGYGVGHGYLPGFRSYDHAWLDSLTRLVQQLRGTGVNEPGIAAESAATDAGGGEYADLTESVLHRRPLPGYRRQHPDLL
jgi:hypothetical protein